MAYMLRCPNCFSEKVSINHKQKRIKKSEVFVCSDCGESTRIEHMAHSQELNFDGTETQDIK